MDMTAVLIQLRKERDAIDDAIASLERLAGPGRWGAAHPSGLAAKSPANGSSNGVYRPPNPALGQ
jgi:hypothetical protein